MKKKMKKKKLNLDSKKGNNRIIFFYIGKDIINIVNYFINFLLIINIIYY